MEKFSFVTYSRRRYYIIFLTLCVLAVVIAAGILPRDFNKFIVVGAFVIIMTVIALISRKYSKQQVEVSLTDNFLMIDWISLSDPKRKDQKISWNNIAYHKYDQDKDFVIFQLFPVGGNKISFAVNKSSGLEEFEKFYTCFTKRLEETKQPGIGNYS